MKKLKSIGKILTKHEMKRILGGEYSDGCLQDCDGSRGCSKGYYCAAYDCGGKTGHYCSKE